MYTSSVNASTNLVSAYNLTNFSLAWQPNDSAWSVRLSVNNVFNEFYYVNSLDQNLQSQGGYITGQPGAPREALLTVRRRFSL
jgi:outer membrane receptor protein involved in Fe transport